MNDNDIKLPPLPRLQVPLIEADVSLLDIKVLVRWCERTATDYARAAALAAQPAASAEPREVDMDEYRAMLAAMEQIDPATLPGLTAAQRCALGRFAKPADMPAGDELEDYKT